MAKRSNAKKTASRAKTASKPKAAKKAPVKPKAAKKAPAKRKPAAPARAAAKGAHSAEELTRVLQKIEEREARLASHLEEMEGRLAEELRELRSALKSAQPEPSGTAARAGHDLMESLDDPADEHDSRDLHPTYHQHEEHRLEEPFVAAEETMFEERTSASE